MRNEEAGRRIGIGILLCSLLFACLFRIGFPLKDSNFFTDSSAGIMKSDPGLLYYFLTRIVASQGTMPQDFRNDPRVEHPQVVDDAEIDTVSQEFPIAWAYLLLRPAMSLHVFALWFMGIFASLTTIGVFLLARELTGCFLSAGFAAALYALLPGNFRTTGLILMREDFSLPFYALHLALLARAYRLKSGFLLSALALGAALASWHALGFIAAIEGLCILIWFLRTGENPMAGTRAWVFFPVLGGVALAVPALRAAGAFFSLPVLLPAGLFLAHRLRQHGGVSPLVSRAAAPAAVSAGLFARGAFLSGDQDPYAHVWELMLAKIRHLGQLPADPSVLSFDARIMWQGAFSTLGAEEAVYSLGVGLLLLVPVALLTARRWTRKENGEGDALLGMFLLAAALLMFLVSRLVVLTGILLPVAGAHWLRRRLPPRTCFVAMLSLLLAQAALFAFFLPQVENSWYKPAYHTLERRDFLSALPRLVPPGEAIVADPVNSTSILSETGHPIVLQPKWERAQPREALRKFTTIFFQGTPEELRLLIRDSFRSRFLLVDRRQLWFGLRYAGGYPLRAAKPHPGTAAETFTSGDPQVFGRVPGYRLLYRSPSRFLDEKGLHADSLRLYQIMD